LNFHSKEIAPKTLQQLMLMTTTRMSLGHFTSADPSHATHPLRFLWNLVCW